MKRQPTFFGGNSGEDRFLNDTSDLNLSFDVEQSYVEYSFTELNRFNKLKELSAIRDAFAGLIQKERQLSAEEEKEGKSKNKDEAKYKLTQNKLSALQSFLNVVMEKITAFNQVSMVHYRDFIDSGRKQKQRNNTWTLVEYNNLLCAHLALEILQAVALLSYDTYDSLFAERDKKKESLLKASKNLGQGVGALAGYPFAASDTVAKAGGGLTGWLVKRVTNVSDKCSTTEKTISLFLHALNTYLSNTYSKPKLDLNMPLIDMTKIFWLSPKTERKEGEIYLELKTYKKKIVNDEGLTVETSGNSFCALFNCFGNEVIIDLFSSKNSIQIPDFKKLEKGEPLSTLCKLTIFSLVAKKMKELQLDIKLLAGLNEFSDAYLEQQKRNAAKSTSKLEQKSQLRGSTEGEFDEVAEEQEVEEVEEQFVEQEEEERESLGNSM